MTLVIDLAAKPFSETRSSSWYMREMVDHIFLERVFPVTEEVVLYQATIFRENRPGVGLGGDMLIWRVYQDLLEMEMISNELHQEEPFTGDQVMAMKTQGFEVRRATQERREVFEVCLDFAQNQLPQLGEFALLEQGNSDEAHPIPVPIYVFSRHLQAKGLQIYRRSENGGDRPISCHSLIDFRDKLEGEG